MNDFEHDFFCFLFCFVFCLIRWALIITLRTTVCIYRVFWHDLGRLSWRLTKPCLLRRASVIAHHHTLKMVFRSAIFSTPKSGRIIHNKIQKMKMHTWISLRRAICSTAGIFKRQGLGYFTATALYGRS